MDDLTDNGPLPSFPACVAKVRVATEEMYRVLFHTPFPDLDRPHTTDEEVKETVKMAKAWASAVQNAYGDPEQPNFQESRSIGDLFGRFNPRAFPHAPWNAADVLGDIPSHLRYSGTGFFGPWTDIVPAHDTESFPAFSACLSQWPQVRAVLRNSQIIVMSKALGLIAWIQGQIQQLESALFPRITTLSERGSSHVVEVNQAGRKRDVTITDGQAEFLADLARKPSATYYRAKKGELLKSIPELRPWISTHPTARQSRADQGTASYQVPEALRKQIQINRSGTKKLRSR